MGGDDIGRGKMGLFDIVKRHLSCGFTHPIYLV